MPSERRQIRRQRSRAGARVRENEKMPRNYQVERDGVIRRWYGGNPQPRNPRPSRTWTEGTITQADCLGIPIPVNSPFFVLGHCMAWKYGLNRDGYGTLTIDGRQELAHRAVFIQTQGTIPEGMQINHLCNRPYCVQPSHLYAGSKQDNRDDSLIFSQHELMNAPWVLHWPGEVRNGDPLLQRLRESSRHDGREPWEPVEQPPQLPLEEFSCPRHDFAITMQGGESRICRICEVSEFDEERANGRGTWMLVAEICPTSQTVTPILEKIANSEFFGESHLETRRRAYRRESQPFREGSHNLRNCGCDYCNQDRRTFRDVLDPLLTREESEILDICDRLEPRITDALYNASAAMMEALAGKLGMINEQVLALRVHIRGCPNSTSELTRKSRTIESDFAYLLYALGQFQEWAEMLDDQGFQQVMMRWDTVMVMEEDEEDIFRSVLPAADETAERMALAWETEAGGLMRPYLENKPGFHEDIRFLARLLAKKHIFEHLRYELLGRNSSTEQRPHPHSGCAISIRETGQVEHFTSEFEKGMGYRLGQDPEVPKATNRIGD